MSRPCTPGTSTEPTRRLRARLYRQGHKAYRRALLLGDGLWCGFWLGVLSHPDFHAIDEAFYKSQTAYRTDAHNRRGLFLWEEQALARHFPPSGSLLVVGAGGGREVLALSARPYEVEAYECHPELVRYARAFLEREGYSSPVHLLPRDAAPTEGGPYNGAIVGWSAYMLIPRRQRRIEFLRGIRSLVGVGDPILLSFFTRKSNSARLRIVKELGTLLRRLRHQEAVEIGDDLAPNYVHRFTPEEAASEMAEAGFQLAFFQHQGPGQYDSGYAVGNAMAIVDSLQSQP